MTTQRSRPRPMAGRMPAVHPCVAILSALCISPAVALSQNPTNRYLKEIGRLLQDHQLNVVASPDAAPLEMESNQILDDDSELQYNGYDWQQYQPPPSSQTNGEPATLDTLDEQSPPPQAAQQRHATPRPPEDPYYRRQKQLFEGYYRQNMAPNKSSHQPNSQQVPEADDQPRRDADLFEALNEQIEALDQQMQTQNSLQDDTGDIFYQPESEWEYDGGNYETHETQADYSPPQSQYEYAGEDFSLPQTEYEYVEADGSVYAPTQQYLNEANGLVESYEANGQYESYEPTPNEALLRQELERLAAEKRAAEEAAARAEQELRERERLERERLEQERTTAAQAEAARAELKKALQREMARYEAEKRNQRPSSIVRSNRIGTLPETRDPFELLGLDYRNPPKSADELRRAYVRMAKQYHPDAIASDATQEERETASLNFARINTAYRFLKERERKWREMMEDQTFATTTGGSMYDEPRNSHIRQSFSRGYGFDGYGSIFSGSSNGPRYGGQHRPQNEYNPNPFSRNNRRDVGNCHVADEDWY